MPKLSNNPLFAALILCAISLLSMLVASLAVGVVLYSQGLEVLTTPAAMRWVQAGTSVATFIIPVFVWRIFFPHFWAGGYSPKLITARSLLLGLLLVAGAIPVALLLEYLNSRIPMPYWVDNLNAASQQVLVALLAQPGAAAFVANLLVIAILAALSEELFFRGTLQPLLHRAFGGHGHAAVWATAVIFALVHMEFTAIIPRIFLGAVLGYLYLYTRSIWIPVLGHSVNNALAVVLARFSTTEELLAPDTSEILTYWYLPALGCILLGIAYQHLRLASSRQTGVE